MKVAIVHYWLVSMRGGEKVVERILELFPQADIYTLVADEAKLSETFRKHKITTSFLQKIGGKKHYQKMLPLMPYALESFDLTSYDLVISSEAGPAKGIVTRPDAVHICYCHSPMRYIWDLYPQYLASSGRLTKAVMAITAPGLRQWDVTTSHRVDRFVANSQYVAMRINKFYRREAEVIHPPVDVARFESTDTAVSDYYLCAGQITAYKKIELAIEACNALGRRLVILGSGASDKLRKMAGPTIEFLGSVDDATMERNFRECRALLYPGVEDFGIVPLEVMASGRPVIAFGRGGATETILHRQTGLLFEEQASASLKAAIEDFEENEDLFDPEVARQHARKFDAAAFKQNFRDLLISSGIKV